MLHTITSCLRIDLHRGGCIDLYTADVGYGGDYPNRQEYASIQVKGARFFYNLPRVSTLSYTIPGCSARGYQSSNSINGTTLTQ